MKFTVYPVVVLLILTFTGCKKNPDENAGQSSFVTATNLNTANWMSKLSNNLKLGEIMMPGSHDAGMSELHQCLPPIKVESLTKTQAGSVGQQLIDGSRYFDIRIDYDKDHLVTYHRNNSWGCNGQELKTIFDQTQEFLKKHTTEMAIFKFSHIRTNNDPDSITIKKKINDLLRDYSSFIYKNSSTTINLAQIAIGDIRGKIILVFDYAEYIDASAGKFRYKDGDKLQPNANISMYDVYSNTSDFEAMKNNQLQKWKDHDKANKDYFFLLSWTLTASLTKLSVEDLATEANAKLPRFLNEQIITNHAGKPNIVYIDFINNVVTQNIIKYNFSE